MRSGYRLVCSPVRAPKRAHYTRVGGWVTNERHAYAPDWADRSPNDDKRHDGR